MEIKEKHGLSNIQLELLKLYSNNVSEGDLIEIRTILGQYFAKKAMDEADKVWELNDWNQDDMKRMTQVKMRSKSK